MEVYRTRTHGRSDQAAPATRSEREAPDAGQTADACPLSGGACDKFRTACGTLAVSTPETVEANWATAADAMEPILRNQPWIRERFQWFALHKFDALTIACGFDDRTTTALLRLIVTTAQKDNASAVQFLRAERDAICQSGARYAEAVRDPGPQATLGRARWDAFCAQQLNGNGVASADAEASGSATTPVALVPDTNPTVACEGLQELAARRDAMAASSFNAADWIAYGRTLAACGPDRKPWETLRLERGREQYLDDYLVPFINRDAVSGDRFQRADSKAYSRVIREWKIEE